MPSDSTIQLPVTKITANVGSTTNDTLAAEEPLEIRLEYFVDGQLMQKTISVTMRTPGDDRELAIGFLFTEGIISSKDDIEIKNTITGADKNIITISIKPEVEINIKKLERHFYTTSSCGVCGKTSIDAIKTVCRLADSKNDEQYPAAMIKRLPEQLRIQQDLFDRTGGLHASALFNTTGELIMLKEDVGRHNALDKLIGAALLADMMPLNEHILLLSGRISFELVQKAAMAGIKIITAIGAPSSLAVETATAFDMTLIGFLRDQRFNIYSGAQRIVI